MIRFYVLLGYEYQLQVLLSVCVCVCGQSNDIDLDANFNYYILHHQQGSHLLLLLRIEKERRVCDISDMLLSAVAMILLPLDLDAPGYYNRPNDNFRRKVSFINEDLCREP